MLHSICIQYSHHKLYRVEWGKLEHMGNLERACKSGVHGKLQVKFSICNVHMELL